MEKTLAELASLIQGKVVGDGTTKIVGIASLEHPREGHLAYVTDSAKLKEAEQAACAALIVPESAVSSKKPLIQSKHPKLAWAILIGLFHPSQTYSGAVSKQAVISNTAQIAAGVTIEPFAFVGDQVTVGHGSVIRSYAYLDQACSVGEQSVIHPFTMLYPNTKVGNRVTIHAGTVIGSDGFGYVFDGTKQAKVPQVGNVIIEDDVEIGACVTIDRATIGSTIIRQGVKIDNLVQIAHNVEIGAHTCLSAQVGISGSSKVGRYVTMGGRVGLGDHVEIGDQVMLGAQAGIPTGKKIPPKQIWIGSPARPYHEMRKQVSAQLRSNETRELVYELKKRIESLERELSQLRAVNNPSSDHLLEQTAVCQEPDPTPGFSSDS